MNGVTEGKALPKVRERSWLWPARVVACLGVLVVGAAGFGSAQAAGAAAGGAAVLSHATDLGPMSAGSPIELTVWLKMRDSDGLDRSAAQGSGGAWLSEEQIDQLHAPSGAAVKAVSAFLKAGGLSITAVGPHNLFVKAAGTAAAVDAAFRVQLHRYIFKDTPFHASRVLPMLPSAIAPLVASVGGLNDLPASPMVHTWDPRTGAKPNVKHPSDLQGEPWKLVPLSAAGPDGILFSAQCFYAPTTVSFSNATATATYQGRVYGASINNTAPGTVAPCGYQPSDLQTAYNLKPLYAAGLDGTGETVAIIDAYGSITLQRDVAAFSSLFGLPPANVQVIGATPTGSEFSSDRSLVAWAGETTGDVEMVHAIAPGAKIVVVVAPSPSLDDLMAANLTAAQLPGVVSISNSWGYVESFTDPMVRASADSILKLAAAKGMADNFASGDSGNFSIGLGYEDVSYPASSPYATAVGGVSVALDESKHILFQTAWGTNATLVSSLTSGSEPSDPPVSGFFIEGGGGGVSNAYPLPPWQASLSRWGSRRLVPDLAWLADPFTGVEALITLDAQGDQAVGLGGGTSVACPLFSALWAIAAQKARRPLGQAAPLLYRLPPGAITDVLPPALSGPNVTGTLTDANGTQTLTSEELALPLQGQSTFLSALYNAPGNGLWFVVTFGTDSTLRVAPGWDPATGLGTPNGVAFVNAVAP